jgi:hypothetical protein
MKNPPPLYTVLVELVGWTLGRTPDIPKSHRFTFGQRLDNLTLDALLLVVRAVFATGGERRKHLTELNLQIEQLRVLWRLVQEQRWISQQQLLFINAKLDEAGRMAGGWLKQQTGKTAGATP